MKRGETGQYETMIVSDETVRAFVPAPLPPTPVLDLVALQGPLEKALLALGRLDSLSVLLPDTHLFLYTYVRKEAVLSSQIEGTQSSLSDLLLFELEEMPGTPLDDVVEVSNYVAALEHGLCRIREGFPLCNRLIREIHAELLARGRGSDKTPGEFRRSQNWIGGSRPGTARFVPAPAHAVAECMSDLERFLHTEACGLPALLRAGLAHVQFETIHPFLDGNGRVGRLLITFLLCHDGVLREPLLYLSLYFKQHRESYYDLLNDVRKNGDWEAWLEFFLNGVTQTAEGAVSTAQRLLSLFQEDQAKIQQMGRAAGSALRVHQALQEHPIASLQELAKRTELSFPAVTAGIQILEQVGVVRELTGKKRNRLFGYDQYLAILGEGTELP
ncbi:MAG: Fic family protein [Candidatus Latescibacteria bacterium]|nr:Fic family protein [Candidatus Latescibacterota bacterium]